MILYSTIEALAVVVQFSERVGISLQGRGVDILGELVMGGVPGITKIVEISRPAIAVLDIVQLAEGVGVRVGQAGVLGAAISHLGLGGVIGIGGDGAIVREHSRGHISEPRVLVRNLGLGFGGVKLGVRARNGLFHPHHDHADLGAGQGLAAAEAAVLKTLDDAQGVAMGNGILVLGGDGVPVGDILT